MQTENTDIAERGGAEPLEDAAPELDQLQEQITGVHHTDSVQRHHNFISRFLPHRRDLVVYLPPDYQASDRRYPVLYLHDGQNLFDPETAYVRGMDWRADETTDALIRAGEIQPLIIVGIFNTGVHRIDEYTPTRDRKLGGGRADLYGRLLVEELKPFIDERYRTASGPTHTAMGGSSLGGLVTLYLGLRYPEVFGKLAALSPSVWWDNRAILKIVTKLGRQGSPRRHRPDIKQRSRPKIWVSMGTDESKNGVRDANLLWKALLDLGWREGKDLIYQVVEGGKHSEADWAKMVEPVLKYLFPA